MSAEPAPQPSAPQPVPTARKPLVVSSGMTRREWMTVILITVVILGFIGSAIYYTATHKPKNTITGVVTGRSSTGERETLYTVAPHKGVRSKTEDTGYYLKVFVKDQNRTYTVIVEKELWEKTKDGDTIDFLRPANEQRY